MRKLTASVLGAAMLLGASSPAFAVHTCGQLLGSCLPHIQPTPVIKPVLKPIVVKPVVIIEPARPVKTN